MAVIGFVIIGGLGLALEWPWWQRALVCVVPYGLAIFLAGRRRDSASGPTDTRR